MAVYDFKDVIAKVNLRDVCEFFGVELTSSGKNKAKGRLRATEKDMSCEFDFEKGLYHDFGDTQLRGNVINLAGYLQFGYKLDDMRDKERFKEVVSWVGDTFGARNGIQAVTYNRRSDGRWQPLSDREYEFIGLHPQNPLADMIDLSAQTMDEAKALRDKFGDMSLSEIAEKHPATYIAILEDKALPYMYQQKKDYMLTLISLQSVNPNAPLYELEKQKAESTHIKYKNAYATLNRAIPPLSEEGKKRLGRDFALDTRSYNIYPPEEQLKKITSGMSVQLGNVTNDSFKDIASARSEETRTIRNISVPSFREFADNANFKYSAFYDAKKDSIAINVMATDTEKALYCLGWSENKVKQALKDVTSVSSPEAREEAIKSFRSFVRHKMVNDGMTQKDLGGMIGVSYQRISEALAGTNPVVAEKLATALKYKGQRVWRTEIVSGQKEFKHFNDLSEVQRNFLVDRQYNSKANEDNYSDTGKKKTREQISQALSRDNRRYVYNANLDVSRTSVNRPYKYNCDYNRTFRKTKTYYVRVPYRTKAEQKAVDKMLELVDANKVEYSSILAEKYNPKNRLLEKTGYLTVSIHDDENVKDKLFEASVKANVVFDVDVLTEYQNKARIRLAGENASQKHRAHTNGMSL